MWSQYTFHGALVEVGLHFGLHPNCCRPLMHHMHGIVQRLPGHPAVHPPSAHPAVRPSTKRCTTTKEFNVGQFLVDRASPIPSPSAAGINQYGSMFQYVTIQQRDTSDEDVTPPHPNAGRQRPSPEAFPIHQPSPMDEDIERHEDPDVQGR